MAAKFIGECLDHGNFDAEVMSIWHDRWMDKFGSDFKWSVSRDQHSWSVVDMVKTVSLLSAIFTFTYLPRPLCLGQDNLLVAH